MHAERQGEVDPGEDAEAELMDDVDSL